MRFEAAGPMAIEAARPMAVKAPAMTFERALR